MLSREDALTALLARIRAVASENNPALLLSSEAVLEADQLAAVVHPEEDEQAAALLGLFHFGRYEALGAGEDQDDFAKAVSYFAVLYRIRPEIVPPPIREHLDHARRDASQADGGASATDRGLASLERFRRSAELADLRNAIALFREGLAAAPADGAERARRLSNLGAALRLLSEQEDNRECLAEAVQVLREGASISAEGGDSTASEGQSDRWIYQANLCAALATLSERTASKGGVNLLSEAVAAGRAAVAGASASGADRGAALSGLGNALMMMWERTGNETPLHEAVKAHRAAAETTPEGHPRRAVFLMNAANALQELFEVTQDTAALTAAIDLSRDAIADTGRDQPDWPGFQASLGNALIRLAKRTARPGLAESAIDALSNAVTATPAHNPYRAIYLSGLGSAFLALAEQTGEVTDLAKAVNAFRDAVAAVPPAHPRRCGLQYNLAGALKTFGEQAGDFRALTEAVYTHRAAVAETEPDDPGYPARLSGLGDALRTLSQLDDDPDLPVEARDCFNEVADNSDTPVHERIWAYRQLAQLAEPADALAAIERAVALLPRLAPAALATADRIHQLGRLAGIAGEAADAAVTAGQPERAAELLEQARGMLTADRLNARGSELARLRDQAPDLARDFEAARNRLDTLSRLAMRDSFTLTRADRQASLMDAGRDTAARRAAQSEWELLLDLIRSTEGFADFLRTPRITELTAEACEGPVVFVYTSPGRCGALALTGDSDAPVLAIPLDALTEDDVRQYASRVLLAHSSGSAARAAQAELPAVLEWMWDTITGPILSALGLTGEPVGRDWPRLWWCPVGILAFLPLHAAGHHADRLRGDTEAQPHPRTVIDRVVSSYTSTVRSLDHARKQLAADRDGTLLIVAAPNAPGAPSLRWASAEANAIAELMPGSYVLQDPGKQDVLVGLASHSAAHFACHAYANWREPSSSTLILNDYQESPLTVADIIEQKISGTLAYLSACETTLTKLELADEGAHLTGAFYMAGYQQVIGTLWPVYDKSARDIALEFYAALSRLGSGAGALALHHAIRQIRAREPGKPTLWASHIHTGV